MIIEALW